MRARDERESIGVVECLRDVLAKRVSGPARGNAPAAPVVGVRPQQVAHGGLRDFFIFIFFQFFLHFNFFFLGKGPIGTGVNFVNKKFWADPRHWRGLGYFEDFFLGGQKG